MRAFKPVLLILLVYIVIFIIFLVFYFLSFHLLSVFICDKQLLCCKVSTKQVFSLVFID